MSMCMWCPKVSTTTFSEGDTLFMIGAGYTFKMTTIKVGLYSGNVQDKYLQAPVSNLGEGFIGITCDAANEQLIAMLDNGTLGTVEKLNATSIVQSSYDSYNRIILGNFADIPERRLYASVVAFGNAMTVEQMTQFKNMITTFLTSLNIISE